MYNLALNFFKRSRAKISRGSFLKKSRESCKKIFSVLLSALLISGNIMYSMMYQSPVHAATATCGAANTKLVTSGNISTCDLCSDATLATDVGIHICAANFPDANFRSWITTSVTHNEADANGQMAITPDQINAVTSLDMSNQSISDLTGIELFSKLTTLNCSGNSLTSLDLSGNSALTSLDCSNNKLLSLKVAACTSLATLTCGNNNLASLDLSVCNGNNNLTTVTLAPQAATFLWDNTDENNFTVDMGTRISAIDKVSIPDTTNWKYDSTTGIATYIGDVNNVPSTLTYNFDTGTKINNVEQLMQVTATLSNVGVIFNPNNGNDAKQVLVQSGNKVPAPDFTYTTTDSGVTTYYSLLGWYTSTDGGKTLSKTAFDFKTTLTQNTVLYAKWQKWADSTVLTSAAQQSNLLPISADIFPDENFRNWITNNVTQTVTGYLTQSDCENAPSTNNAGIFNMSGQGISDLTGIQYFTKLKELYCSGNKITNLDVSKNVILYYLDCSSQALSSLTDESSDADIMALIKKYCSDQGVTTPDDATLKQIIDYYKTVINNGSTSGGSSSDDLISQFIGIYSKLDSAMALILGEIVSTIDEYYNQRQLSTLVLNDNLQTLNCSDNRLTTIENLSNNTLLENLNCNNNMLKSLDVSSNTSLVYLNCRYNVLESLKLGNNSNLQQLSCNGSSMSVGGSSTVPTKLDASALISFIQKVSDNGTANQVKFLTSFFSYVTTGNTLKELDVSGCPAITTLNCGNNALTSLDLSKNTALTTLDCSLNNLTSLDVHNNTNLTSLSCGCNELTELDVSKNTNLTSLLCSNRWLTPGDLNLVAEFFQRNCTDKQMLDGILNDLIPALATIGHSGNQLKTLDLTANTKLSSLYCSNQVLNSQWQYNADTGKYTVDMNKIVGSDNISRVSTAPSGFTFADTLVDVVGSIISGMLSNLIPSAQSDLAKVLGIVGAWSYDSTTGIMTYNGKGTPPSLIYRYNTNFAGAQSDDEGSDSKNINVKANSSSSTGYMYAVLNFFPVTFHPGSGQSDFQKSLNYDGTVAVPTEPTRTNYKLKNWCTSDNNPFDFSTVVTQNLDLYGKWWRWVEFPDVGAIVAADEGGTLDSYLKNDYTLHVDLLSENSDSYRALYSQLVNATDSKLTGNEIFDVYLTDANGNFVEQENLGEDTEIYLKLPDGWNYDSTKIYYVSDSGTELYDTTCETIDGVTYVHITTGRLGNYALVNTGEITSSSAASANVTATGDDSMKSIIVLSCLLLCAWATLIALKKKKEESVAKICSK